MRPTFQTFTSKHFQLFPPPKAISIILRLCYKNSLFLVPSTICGSVSQLGKVSAINYLMLTLLNTGSLRSSY